MDLATALYVAGLVGVGVVAYFLYASFAFGAGYQPTSRRVVERMLSLAAVGPADTVFDLGAGTGSIVFAAARRHGARVVGVEVEPIRVAILRARRWIGGPRDRVRIRWGNLYATDFTSATVVAVFLWPAAMARLRPVLESELRPGARVVSHWHRLPGWTPLVADETLRVYLYRRGPGPELQAPSPGSTDENGTRAPPK
jgi:SAM-dependent methyltransferase